MTESRHNAEIQRSEIRQSTDRQRNGTNSFRAINSETIESYLYNTMHTPAKVRPEKMQETIQECIAQVRRSPVEDEERTSFWAYLSDIFHFEGMSIFGLQFAALLVSCLGIGTIARIPRFLPAFMPLFSLALVPVLYRNQTCRMAEMEAATRASGAQVVLAKLILAGAAQMLCMTVILGLVISVSGTPERIVQMILYITVPFLVCMAAMLKRIRTCRHGNMTTGTAVPAFSCAAWCASAQFFPWLYETSATGLWIAGFVVFAAFFIKEICYIVQMRKEGKMYGIIN